MAGSGFNQLGKSTGSLLVDHGRESFPLSSDSVWVTVSLYKPNVALNPDKKDNVSIIDSSYAQTLLAFLTSVLYL